MFRSQIDPVEACDESHQAWAGRHSQSRPYHTRRQVDQAAAPGIPPPTRPGHQPRHLLPPKCQRVGQSQVGFGAHTSLKTAMLWPPADSRFLDAQRPARPIPPRLVPLDRKHCHWLLWYLRGLQRQSLFSQRRSRGEHIGSFHRETCPIPKAAGNPPHLQGRSQKPQRCHQFDLSRRRSGNVACPIWLGKHDSSTQRSPDLVLRTRPLTVAVAISWRQRQPRLQGAIGCSIVPRPVCREHHWH